MTVYGASDDLIEVEGDVTEEFNPVDGENDLLFFSTGDVLRIRYSDEGVWRIEAVTAPHVTITPAPENDEDNYSDRAVVAGEIAWVGHRDRIEFRND